MGDVPSPERKPRTSITKLQRQTAAGADLIALCQTITEDGHLADEEIVALRQWLEDSTSSGLPAQEFLLAIVRRIIEDRKVTDEERRELYGAIETILPPDIREVVRGNRRHAESAAAASARAQQDAQRQRERDAKQRNRPLRSWNFMVAGCRYEGRPELIHRFAIAGDRADLARDRGNRFSRSAVEVRLQNGAQAGYVPEELALEIAPFLDQGLPHTGDLTKVLTRGRSPIPVVQARVFGTDADGEDLVFERDVPTEITAAASVVGTAPVRRSGCLPVALLLGVVAWVVSITILTVEP